MDTLTESSPPVSTTPVQQVNWNLRALSIGLKSVRADLMAFARWCDPSFKPVTHQRQMAALLQGQAKRLLLIVPPSHGKSRLATEACAWMLGHNPALEILLASHAEEQALRSSREIRDRIAQSARYKLVFPAVSLHRVSQAVSGWRLSAGGGLQAVQVGEPVRGHDLLIVDDPFRDCDQAQSGTFRERVWDWYRSVAFTRLKPDGRIVVICSRTHSDDVAGRLIAEGGWEVLVLTAVNSSKEAKYTGSGSEIQVSASEFHVSASVLQEALWPERVPLDYLRKTEAAIGPSAWRAMYLGQPDKLPEASAVRTQAPSRSSFREFLRHEAMVRGDSSDPATRGTYQRYTFEGREALEAIVEVVDLILSTPLKDATVSLGGGAQFGKTALQHNFLPFATGQLFRNVVTFLPSEDLVRDLVQVKFRPDVVDQLPWFASMIQIGKMANESGKVVDRVGAFMVGDGIRRATGIFTGLHKVPTSVSGDIALVDEVDDVDPQNEKFISGRLSQSDLRFTFKMGTQRIHGRGMNRAWREGSQGVVELVCANCGHAQNPEESFPQIVCLKEASSPQSGTLGPNVTRETLANIEGSKSRFTSLRNDGTPPRLTYSADFQRNDVPVCSHDPSNRYFLGCVKCGTELDRSQPQWRHRKPDQQRLNNWSFRISQLGIGAIELGAIVNAWRLAVEDESKMLMFRTDVLGIPRSSAQKLEPEIMDRARRIEVFDAGAGAHPNYPRYAGLDMGGRCWFTVREVVSPIIKRIVWAESIPLHQVGQRVPQLVKSLGVGCTFIDQLPETKESRSLALALNGLDGAGHWPRVPSTGPCHVTFPGGLAFVRNENGDEKWISLKAACIRFDHKRLGKGISSGLDMFTGPSGNEICAPLILCNRFETVDAVVREFLTPSEGELDTHSGTGLRAHPAVRLPKKSSDIWQTFEDHHIAGSERERDDSGNLGDYIDSVPNHFLFANAYSKLAEIVGARAKSVPFVFGRVERGQGQRSGI